jgi:hypothetical protein
MIASTPSTTRPGSEATNLAVGDAVRCRQEGRSANWSRYAGREGWVAAVNAQAFPDGTKYVEIGVTWTSPTPKHTPSAAAWFRTDELEAR